MWINPLFQTEAMGEVRKLIAANSLATIVVENPLRAAHVPLLLEEVQPGKFDLLGHITIADPAVTAIENAASVLAIFHGARAYISPDWYESAGLPTYNFSVAHLSGPAAMMTTQELRNHLVDLIHTEEGRRDPAGGPWDIDAVADRRIDQLLPAVRGFRIRVDTAQAKAKLGQNRSPEDRAHSREELLTATVPEHRQVGIEMTEIDDAQQPKDGQPDTAGADSAETGEQR